ncbi:hypothetical protein [Clostridium butyricum]|uniref:hypothetical protein n=1 Tax=Clostridium butyricum TaxID=1492 RepID=UPI001E2B872A|nr:hypothetical protein [Clostridium butyricum]
MFKKADYKNIKRYLEDIDTFNSTPDFGTTRVLFTEEELKARKYVKNEMNKIGLEVSEDAMGNIFLDTLEVRIVHFRQYGQVLILIRF